MQDALLRQDNGVHYRDLNKNGHMDPYENPRLPIEQRVDDLVQRMTLHEKAGMMFHTMTPIDDEMGMLRGLPPTRDLIEQRLMNSFNLVGIGPAATIAQRLNDLQSIAAATRLGIPLTISTDPRHAFSRNIGASMAAGSFSQWPEAPGLAAVGDESLVEQFGDIARQEYRAVGIHLALHPMADLATEPRWARIVGTFGENADVAARMTAAYIRGFQGKQLGSTSVACMTKHFPGGGPQMDGEDAHFPYGREQIYPGHNFDYHLRPFEAAFAVGTAQIMPYYGMPIGVGYEEVGFGFNRAIITGLLRERYGFNGVVCADWGLLTDSSIGGRVLPARAWGVEHLSLDARVAKALDAGIDQFGGEACPDVVVRLAQSGTITEERLDISVRRILTDKFRLGLFDAPYVDPAEATAIVGQAAFRAAGERAQRRSLTLLKNGSAPSTPLLPLRGRPRIYIENLGHATAMDFGDIVESPDLADVAILNLQTPYEPRDTLPLESFFHAGDLSFAADEEARFLGVMAVVPTIVVINMDRPAIIPRISAHCHALLAYYGANDAAILDVLWGRATPEGNLPFELPSSMEAVRQQYPDVPADSANPLFASGAGLRYDAHQA